MSVDYPFPGYLKLPRVQQATTIPGAPAVVPIVDLERDLSARPAGSDQAICLLTSSLNSPSTSMSSLKEPLCTTFPAFIT